MHSSAKSPGLPGESQDETLAHIQKGFMGWICYQHTHTHIKKKKNPIYTEGQTSVQSDAFMYAPCCSVSSQPHCSVSQDGSLAVIHSRDPPFPEWVTHTGL